MKTNKEIKNVASKSKNQPKTGFGIFLNLCKYDIVPAFLAGSIYTLVYNYEAVLDSTGPVDNMIMGGITGVALVLIVNGVIAAASKIHKDKEKGKKS